MTPWNHLRPKKKLQNILSSLPLQRGKSRFYFFSGEEDIGDWYVYPAMKFKSFHNTNGENKSYHRIFLLSSGVRSFRCKVVSVQVDLIQIEVVSWYNRSQFDTRRKSIRFNSTFMFSTVLWFVRCKNCNPGEPMKILPGAHSYENTSNTRFFWGAGQKLRKSLTSKCLRIFLYDRTISRRKSK